MTADKFKLSYQYVILWYYPIICDRIGPGPMSVISLPDPVNQDVAKGC